MDHSYIFQQFFLLITESNLQVEKKCIGRLEVTKWPSGLSANLIIKELTAFWRRQCMGEITLYAASLGCVLGLQVETRAEGQLC